MKTKTKYLPSPVDFKNAVYSAIPARRRYLLFLLILIILLALLLVHSTPPVSVQPQNIDVKGNTYAKE